MRFGLSTILPFLLISNGKAAPPSIVDDRLVIELAAREPNIVTPTGLAVDEQGRVWVIENNTHQRPANYKGHPTDRIRILSDAGPDGMFRKVDTFADGFKNGMGLALDRNGDVFLATRSDIWRLRDTSNSGHATERTAIVKLQTPGDYPHNGLSGFAFDARGNMYFSLGENLGASYKLVGSDGTTLTGGGEGGSIYRCRPDGTHLVRVATGFWNTFHLTFDSFGRLFAVDNDPDSRGPCRLLHIVQGGDYGYRFRNGRRGLHPFTAWNGELPGTLPMVAGTAEAPSGILAYDANGLPDDYRDILLTTSWGDHVIETFRLKPRGSSFDAKSKVLVRGGDDFRPVGIVTAPDGSLYVSDWVDKSYPVHGKGRIWRIRMKDAPKDDGLRPSQAAKLPVEQLKNLLGDSRREIRIAAATALAANGARQVLVDTMTHSKDVKSRLNALWALESPPLDDVLRDASPEVRAEGTLAAGRIQSFDEKKLLALTATDPSAYVRMNAMLALRERSSVAAIMPALGDNNPFIFAAALSKLGQPGNADLLASALDSPNPRLRLGVLLALRQSGEAAGRSQLFKLLEDPSPEVRRAAIQWVGEERLTEHRQAIETSAAKEPITRDLFEALLAAKSMLANTTGKPSPESSGEENVARIVKDPKQPVIFRTFSLRMLRADHPVLTTSLLTEMLKCTDQTLHNEVVRTLAQRSDDSSQQSLRTLAMAQSANPNARAFAVLGLPHSASTSTETRRLLLVLLNDVELRRDALRSLRGISLTAEDQSALKAWWNRLPPEKGGSSDERRELAEQLLFVLGATGDDDAKELRKQLAGMIETLPIDESGWRKALAGKGDASAGERVFLHLRGARCAVCHRIDGRGGQVGPELSVIAGSHSRDKLIESIVLPSKEIAPAFTTWTITMYDGKSHTGVIIGEGFDSTLTLADAEGKRIVLKKLDIESRQASTKSLMPDDLAKQMTRREFRDLLEYLETRRPVR